MTRREIPQINAGSMADIAFLLLIFFLVTTTMDTDMGILRLLSPAGGDPPDINKRNVLEILVNRNNNIMIEGDQVAITDVRTLTREFLENRENKNNLPEKKWKDIPLIGQYEVTKGIISLQTDRGTSYEIFIGVLNEITAAGDEIKNKVALQYFSKSFDQLSKEQKKAVSDAAPAIISEAEPNEIR